MKKFAVLFTFALVLVLSGCAEKKTTVTLSDIEIIQSTPAISTPQPTQSPEDKFKAGKFSGNVYTNEFFGLSCETDSNMKHYGKTKLAELSGLTAQQYTSGDLLEVLLDSGSFCDMYCYTEEGDLNINLFVQYIEEEDRELSEEEIRDVMIPLFREEIVANGIENIQLQKIDEQFCGKERFGLILDAEFEGMKYFCRQYYIRKGNFLGVVSLCSFDEDTTPMLKAMWNEIKD